MTTDLKTLFAEFVRTEQELWDAVDDRLRSEHELPLTWFEPMQLMARFPACRVYDIKEELLITIGGTSKLVDRIEAAGFCRRRANPDDRRSQIIELTPAGAALLIAATRTLEDELESRIGSVLTTRAIGQLRSTLVKLRAARRAETQRDEVSSA